MLIMDNEAAREIAEAAVEFVAARSEAFKLKAKRAEALSSGECPREVGCYRIERLRPDEWCDRCKRAQPAHEEYRRAATQGRGAGEVAARSSSTFISNRRVERPRTGSL